MGEYTFKDIIIDPEDERVELRRQYYFSNNPRDLLNIANRDDRCFLSRLQDVRKEAEVSHPFQNMKDVWHSCIIRAKEEKEMYLTYDFDYFATRKSLIGRFVKADMDEVGQFQGVITGFQKSADDDFWCACISGLYMVTAEEFLEDWTFEDNTPCGREM